MSFGTTYFLQVSASVFIQPLCMLETYSITTGESMGVGRTLITMNSLNVHSIASNDYKRYLLTRRKAVVAVLSDVLLFYIR